MKGFKTLTSTVTLFVVASLVNGQTSKVGQWDYVGNSGVSTMHGLLAPGTNKVIFIERVELATEVYLNGKPTYTVEYDLTTNKIRPLSTRSNTFCSAGSYMKNGTIVNLGGAEATQGTTQGFNQLRIFNPCTDGKCDWQENGVKLLANRWYPTVEQLSDGTLFIMGGASKGVAVNDATSNVPSFETYPSITGSTPVQFQFLIDTLPYNLYPSVHLLPDKNLFIMANTRSIILDTTTWKIIKTLPDIPGPPRSYPLTGGTVLLPLNPSNNYSPEILVCGGADKLSADSKGEATCGRILPLSTDPKWEMETMPLSRLMPDLVILADGKILIINGCNKGTAGFGKGEDPVLTSIIYDPKALSGARFTTLQPSYIPRMYHSIAFTVPSGQVLVSGSNPNKNPTGAGPYPTDFRVELYSPPFLFTGTPQLEIKSVPGNLTYNQTFDISYVSYSDSPKISVNILNSGFVTHSTHMSQRQVWLDTTISNQKLSVTTPANGGMAPPGPYLLFVVDNGVPSNGVWIMLSK